MAGIWTLVLLKESNGKQKYLMEKQKKLMEKQKLIN